MYQEEHDRRFTFTPNALDTELELRVCKGVEVEDHGKGPSLLVEVQTEGSLTWHLAELRVAEHDAVDAEYLLRFDSPLPVNEWIGGTCMACLSAVGVDRRLGNEIFEYTQKRL